MSSHPAEFVEEMKKALIAEEKQLKGELGQIAHNVSGDYQPDYPDYGRDDESNAVEASDFQNTKAVTEANEERLKDVEGALARIEEGKYGIAEDGALIPVERLRANPAATTAVVKPQ